MPTWRSVIIYLFASLLVSAIFHSNLLARLAVDSPQKVGVPLASSRTDASDNYVYFDLIKQGAQACNTAAYPAATRIEGNPLACTYIGGVLVGNVLWRLSHAVTTSERAAVSLLLILCTGLLAMSLILAFGAILDRQFGLASSLALAGISLFLLDNFSLSFYSRSLQLNFREVLGLEPGFARLLNPSIFWSLGLLTLACVLLAMRQRSRVLAGLGCAAAAACATAGLAVTASLIGGLALFLALEFLMRRQLDWRVFCVAAVLAIGAAYTLFEFSVFHKTRLGANMHHGEFTRVRINFYFIWLLVPVVIGTIGVGGREQNLLMKCLLLSAAIIGMFCDSVELGSRLWLRGSCIFAFLASAAWLWNLGERYAGPLVGSLFRWRERWNNSLRSAFSAVAVAVILFGAMQIVRPFDLDQPRGFIDRDKYETLTWLEQHTPSNAVIASTSIEDSFLIGFYTQGKPYVPLYGLSILPQSELVKRYFRTVGEVEEGSAFFDKLSMITPKALAAFNGALTGGLKRPFDETAYQAFAFYLMLLYYPYTTESRTIFSANAPTAGFIDWLGRMRDESHRECARFDYFVIRASEHLIDVGRYETLYRNADYAVLRQKASNGGNLAVACP
ncbi:hypothetical protein V4R08_01085 [Nitrobacter sp. NHB1]|uniref:hypothetical protein n=1 Tax=Nitrobacter sp. NHB1 TaxID=3119830 RepID=UPI002FFE0FAF